MKICRTCKKEKEEELFPIRSSNKDGLDTICKDCKSLYRRNYYKKRVSKDSSYGKDWECKVGRKEVKCFSCNNIITRCRTNKGVSFCSLECRRLKYPINFMRYYIKQSSRRAKSTNLEFDLDEDYLNSLFFKEQEERCAVIGNEITLTNGKNKLSLHSQASLDRIDNNLGYVKGNVRFVSLGINYMKNRRSDEELFKMIEIIKTSGISSEVER